MTVDMREKVCVVTGATTGIGRITARELARAGAHVVLTARTLKKGEPVARALRAETGNERIEVHPLELDDLAKVEASAGALLEKCRSLHVLINNAGLAGQRGVTKDGFELHFGVNHLGHFLFTTKLLERLKASSPARIVNVSSTAHYQAKGGIDFTALKASTRSVSGMPEYAVSKLANVLFTKELARRLEGTGVTAYALHPGVVATDVWRRLPGPLSWLIKRFMISPEEGAKTTLFCATDPSIQGESGRYYDKSQERRPSRHADDEALAKRLWEESERFIAEGLAARTAA